MEIETIPIVLVDEFYFYMHHPIKAWIFEKNIFELVYLCILIQSYNHLYPIKAGNISYEDGGIVSKSYYFNLMVSYLYPFNPFITINEIGKYLSHNIV